ncbi:MAG: hypothetical protein A2X81_10305 [Desulfobacterales bacterium GWB2_56_26]|nr:MAG: hypothetical protein A2X81_10305 [Desulfobacterales bacterium GWB2_56_26]
MNTDRFFPKRSETLEQTGLHRFFLPARSSWLSSLSGQEIAKMLHRRPKVIGYLLKMLKQRPILAYQNNGEFNVFYYVLTEQGRQKAQLAQEQAKFPANLNS